MTGFDAVETLETLYRADLDGPTWLLSVIEAMGPLIDPHRNGVRGAFYSYAPHFRLPWGTC